MEEVIKRLTAAKSIAVLTHINEDADALGSSFALAKAMRSLGKTVVIYVSGKIEKRLDFMGGDYKIYDGKAAQEHDLCVCIDCGDKERLGERAELFDAIGSTVNIDHHYLNPCYADANYVDPNASSAGENIYRLLKKMNVEITQEIAADLYTAICSDTGNFKFSNVSSETMYIAGDLIKIGVNNAEISRRLFDSDTIENVKLKAEITAGMESYYGGKVRAVTMTEDMYGRFGISDENVPSLVDIPRGIANTEIALSFKESKGKIRISLRSNGDCNVAAVAEKIGGGGHKKAAGCTVENISLKEIKEKVIKECGYQI